MLNTMPVVPIDPMGNRTDVLPNLPPGPPSQGQFEPLIYPELEQHVYPRSDVMNHPAIVAEMLMPSTSATAMVSPWWTTTRNLLGDADGLPTPLAKRYDGIAAVQNYTGYVANYLREPNTSTGAPSGVKISDLAGRFSAYLAQVQNTLLGAP